MPERWFKSFGNNFYFLNHGINKFEMLKGTVEECRDCIDLLIKEKYVRTIKEKYVQTIKEKYVRTIKE